jgi:hypothetical protein
VRPRLVKTLKAAGCDVNQQVRGIAHACDDWPPRCGPAGYGIGRL